jgi:hypothetical protein
MGRSLLAAAWLLAFGCTGEVEDPIALVEPVRVPEGTFHTGELDHTDNDALVVTSVETASGILTVGQQGRVLAGRVQEDAFAIGLRFAQLGTGWWIHPVDAIDPAFAGERGFRLAYDVGGGVPAGLHALRLAAIDEHGLRGPETDVDVCVQDDALPDNLHACDESLPPPARIVSLSWDRDADLDIVVKTPSGKRITWKTPTSAQGSGEPIPDETLDDPTLGKLDRDSNADCVPDGRNSEAVLWQEAPEPGPYSVYVDMFDACGHPETNFTVSVYHARMRDDGSVRLVQTESRSGTFLQIYADGGAEPPLYVLTTELP